MTCSADRKEAPDGQADRREHSMGREDHGEDRRDVYKMSECRDYTVSSPEETYCENDKS
jgi:hypothetical protein